MPEHSPAPLLGHDSRHYTLEQVAERLSELASAQNGALAAELHTASLCCRDAHARWEDLLQCLQDYRLERSQLTSWFDAQVDLLQQEALGLVVPGPPEDLSHLRPDDAGAYAWDRWQAQALAAGLGKDLAGLGRAVMREAVQHSWAPNLQTECGWSDSGQAMLALALRDAAAVEKRWHYLLETDGERGRWGEDGSWQPL